jgi:TRAP-type C4-dicarboxylate transport system permease small subunit
MSGGMIEQLVQLNGRVTTWLARLAAVFLVIVATMTFCDVIARYIFLKPFSFTVEVTEFCMALIVYLAVGRVTHDDAHINVDFVTLRLRDKTRAILSVVINVLVLVYLVIFIWRLWAQAFDLLHTGDKTQIWGMKFWPLAMIMGVGSLFLLTGTVFYLINAFRRARGEPGLEMSGQKILTD